MIYNYKGFQAHIEQDEKTKIHHAILINLNGTSDFSYKMPLVSSKKEEMNAEIAAFINTLTPKKSEVPKPTIKQINVPSASLKENVDKAKDSKIYKESMKRIDNLQNFFDNNMKNWDEMKAIRGLFLKLHGLVEGAIFRRRDTL